jgi:uncharacterized protein
MNNNSRTYPSPTNSPKTPSRRRLALTGLAVAGLSGLGLIGAPMFADAQSTTSDPTVRTAVRTIVVDGTGRVSQAPDRMILNIGVETRGVKVADALKANNTAADALTKLLKSKAIDAKDIQTSGLSVSTQYDNTGRKLTGYQVNNNLTVMIRNLSTAGDVIDAAATSAGDAIRVNGLSFGLGDTSVPTGKARELAVADARTQAEQLAKAAGVKLGGLRTITASSSNAPQPLTDFKVAQDRASSVPIEAGSFEVSATVQLVFDIG